VLGNKEEIIKVQIYSDAYFLHLFFEKRFSKLLELRLPEQVGGVDTCATSASCTTFKRLAWEGLSCRRGPWPPLPGALSGDVVLPAPNQPHAS
jgi:hypothetical protein